ncbi:IS30 family transposase [Microbacterium thalassium]|uniref:IS30 family transposase n=1 Tax=Microbacterium thalassium TaxID=362649 RepID=A0A7X0KUL1_9MICO|nr:IS30 family transposase [Microbacterium thalassium]MBB6391276.1 IS30 family transposase [Microbacterium thalassium]GLK23612.1 IS30 family transposase [Microbacterium thalassium]
MRFTVAAKDAAFLAVCQGLSFVRAGALIGASGDAVGIWWRDTVGMPTRRSHIPVPDPLRPGARPGRGLSLEERIEIQAGRRVGLSQREIARRIGRDQSVISRELARHRGRDGHYRAAVAELDAQRARRRPKPFKLIANASLAARVEEWIDDGWSPKLIAEVLERDHPDDKTWRVSHETIYQALYVQGRGQLRQDLARRLSTGRVTRRSRNGSGARGPSPFKDALTISDRPAQVEDRAVPGHWEGDLILGAGGRSAIGTLVERTTRFAVLLHLPGRHTADEVANAMIREMNQLPWHLRRSITWDRGTELADYADIQLELQAPVYFCDPHSPWQRGTNENTNRLLRHWFTKGSDLSTWDANGLRTVADKINSRPRPTLGMKTPAQALNEYLATAA